MSSPGHTPGTVSPPLLTEDTVADYVRSRGLLDDLQSVEEIGGGVSSVVLRVDGAARSVIVKQARPRLQVAAPWTAKRERTLTEAAALRAYHEITPSRVPEVLDVDDARLALTMQAAPRDVTNWKSALLADPQTSVSGELPEILGRTLGTWHRSTRRCPDIFDRFRDDQAFEQLRVAPFYRELIRIYPMVVAALEACIDEITTSTECLVHGDFSPKNILVGNDLCWVVDAEVARVGAPVFDVAFMTAHLLMKSVYTGHPPVLRTAANRFIAAYESAAGSDSGLTQVGRHTAALLLARMDGKAPVDYLTSAHREQVRRPGLRLLAGSDTAVADVFDALLLESR